jgi:GTP pyrophosphokinase
VHDNFEVVNVDDKLEAVESPLGYMSVHYLCKMPEKYTGPRYERTRNIIFEIQVRTLCMHCWAAVSHYLDYKGEWDVPTDLKRALSALGGLFYVADNEFEQFYKTREASRKAPKAVGAITDINLDTIEEFLLRKFPDRRQTESLLRSDLVRDIKSAGYTSLDEVEREIDRALGVFLRYEKEAFPEDSGRRFYDVGAARSALYIASDRMDGIDPHGGLRDDGLIKKYRAILGNA